MRSQNTTLWYRKWLQLCLCPLQTVAAARHDRLDAVNLLLERWVRCPTLSVPGLIISLSARSSCVGGFSSGLGKKQRPGRYYLDILNSGLLALLLSVSHVHASHIWQKCPCESKEGKPRLSPGFSCPVCKRRGWFTSDDQWMFCKALMQSFLLCLVQLCMVQSLAIADLLLLMLCIWRWWVLCWRRAPTPTFVWMGIHRWSTLPAEEISKWCSCCWTPQMWWWTGLCAVRSGCIWPLYMHVHACVLIPCC